MTAPLRLVIAASDRRTLAQIVDHLGDSAALGEGRVFVDRRRASPGDPAPAGATVEVWAARAAPADGAAVQILAERGGLIVAFKPAGLASEPDRRGSRSLLTELERLCGATPHLGSRLDVGVSGVVLAGVGEEARRHLAHEKEAGRVARTYVGIAEGRLAGAGVWDTPIGQRRGHFVVGGERPRPATSRFEVLAATPERAHAASATLLRMQPVTGRTHQLRIHASHAGAPLLGDREHGGARGVSLRSGTVRTIDRIALHALEVRLRDARGEPFGARSPLPASLVALWEALDGDPSACLDLGAP